MKSMIDNKTHLHGLGVGGVVRVRRRRREGVQQGGRVMLHVLLEPLVRVRHHLARDGTRRIRAAGPGGAQVLLGQLQQRRAAEAQAQRT